MGLYRDLKGSYIMNIASYIVNANNNNDHGFSLIEMLIVMGLVGIIMGIAVPGLYTNVPKWHVRGTARDIAAKLMVARLKAIQDNKLYAIKFTDAVADTFEVETSDDKPWQTITWTSANAAMGMGTGDINITLESCVSTGGNRVFFKWDGGADTSGGIGTCDKPLADASMAHVLTVASNDGKYSMGIYVGRFTGNIMVQ